MKFLQANRIAPDGTPRSAASHLGYAVCPCPIKETPCLNELSGPRGREIKSAVSFDHLTAVSGVGLSPALATCETSQVLLAGVPGGFSRGSPVFAHLLIGPSHTK